MGMRSHRLRAWRWLAATVLVHFVVSAIHGAAHAGAHIPLSLAANLFVFVVILAGPLIGLAVSWRAERLGRWVVASTMAGALVFGLVNHFILASPDYVAHVAVPWRPLFTTTAALLAATEVLGFSLALSGARPGRALS